MGEADGVRPVLSFQAYAGAGRVGGSALSDQVPVQHIGGIELKTRHGGEDPKLPAAVRGPENRRRSPAGWRTHRHKPYGLPPLICNGQR